MESCFKFRDVVRIEPFQVDPAKARLFECKDSESPTGWSLDTLADLTFAGIVTKNKALYLPEEVRAGMPSFTTPFEKPVQIHHADERDPIGRVHAVRYVSSVGGISKSSQKVSDEIRRLDRKESDVLHLKRSKAMFMELQSLSSDDSFEGLGRIRGHLRITDKDAIQKILDGRYLTLSSGFHSVSAICAACLVEGEVTDWADEMCDHRPGREYNGFRMFLIPKGMTYDEVSYVNSPALPLAKTVEVRTAGFSDSIEIEDSEGAPPLAFFDMFVRDPFGKDGPSVISMRQGRDVNVLDYVDVVGDLAMLFKDGCKDVVCDWTAQDSLSEEEREFFDGSYLLLGQELDSLGFSDAKLSTERRKALKAEDFCGPGRSFPVPDCAHVTAARRMMGRAKVSAATKEKIMACVNRKAKSMGCDKSQDFILASFASKDAMTIKSLADKIMIVSAHDQLHYRFDYQIESHHSDSPRMPPKDQVDLHQKLHKVAKEEGFDDALLLGKLDSLLVEAHPPGYEAKDSGGGKMLSLREITKDSATNYEFVAEHLEEPARLGADALSKLGEDVFIGPGRTFPVHDLAHAAAVRKVLDQMEEGEGLKSLLLSFLDRRQAKLEGNQGLSDSQAQGDVIDPGSGKDASKEAQSTLEDQVAKLSSKVEELTVMRDLLKRHGDSLEQDLDNSVEANLEIVMAAHRLMAEKIADIRIARGVLQKDARDESVRELAGRTWESLKDTLADLDGAGKVQDGLGRETDPAAQVDDPTKAGAATVTTDAAPSAGEGMDLSKYQGIVNKFKDLKTYKGLGHANSWLNEQIRRGYFPAGIEIG